MNDDPLFWMLIGMGTQATIAAMLGHYRIIELNPKQQIVAGVAFFLVAAIVDIGRRLSR
jgi:hypothetical protein